MRLKKGVIFEGISPALAYALGVAEMIFAHYGRELVVTSALDGVHPKGTTHKSGNAADLRIWSILTQDLAEIVRTLKAKLDAKGYDVVLESDHIHLEYDPKRGESWYVS